jgi:[ribosomal protein S18]-alanine N-acetyltransferase
MIVRRRYFLDSLRKNEAEALVEIHQAAFASPWSADDFRALISDRLVFAIAARRRTLLGLASLVGFILVRHVSGEAEVLTVAVRPAERGRGVGRMLMEEALRRLYRDGITACFLEVDRSNRAAVRLYESLGYRVVGERKGYYRSRPGADGGALVMRLELR